jgi:glutaredoxin
MSNSSRAQIERWISVGQTFVVGMRWCPYTKKAVHNAPSRAQILYLEDYPDFADTLDWVKQKFHHDTVPLVFISGEFCGGSEVF